MATKAQRLERRAAGLCVQCGAAVEIGPKGPRSLCREHLDYANAKTTERLRAFVAAGGCVECGAPPARGEPRCATCRDRRRELGVTRYEARRREGRCTRCGAIGAAPDTHVCEVCAIRAREIWHARVALGLCGKCGEQAGDGASLCVAHGASAQSPPEPPPPTSRPRAPIDRKRHVPAPDSTDRNRTAEASLARAREIARARASGETLEQIGRRHGLTRERIRQILLGMRDQVAPPDLET